ncbi:MAG: hypothetical protein ISS59_04880 [Desulfobacteraceae bacterium]|nr:hypothetical protein [Desulfobacteraceae bacterium]
MPSKYSIHTHTVPHRFKAVTKSGIIAWEEGCLKCAVCVKKRCVYGVYDNRNLDPMQMIDSIDNECMNCLRCVQGCPKELIHKSLNPEYQALGDPYWSPDIISKLWYQAETGRIPVSGAGYPGPFSGPGFDSMWTDMSEIVRPTRDGIHGREYISTAIDLGRTARHLSLNDEGMLERDHSQIYDIPLPIMLKMPAFGAVNGDIIKGWAMAAKRLGTLMALPQEMINSGPDDSDPWLIPMISPEESEPYAIPGETRIAEISWCEEWARVIKEIERVYPSLLISVRIPMDEEIEEKALSLARNGVSIIHLEATENGLFMDEGKQYMKDGIRSTHLKLVEAGIRDEITLLASGGIAMAEHVAKAIICGVDAVLIDFPILIALECRMCRRCTKELPCPVEIDRASPSWVASRVTNLVGAWHNQLLEVMGAMGIRDARRLRGEVGRAMFFEELDRATFGSMGKVEEGCELE